jgi:TrmH family RNA methyltransferase
MTRNEIQLIRSLADKRARTEAGVFVCEGAKLVGEVLASGLRVRKIYCTGQAFELFSSEMLGFCADRSREDRDSTSKYSPGLSDEKARKAGVYHENPDGIETISGKEMERISHLKTPTDCLALVEIPSREFDPKMLGGGLTLALDGVQNPGNMGTIIRLADWFGIARVVCSADSADCWSPKVVQATMGAITRVAVHYGGLAAILSTSEVPVYGTFLEGEIIYEANLTRDGIIVLGSEGRGISPEVAEVVSRKLFIPPYPANNSSSESLNVAIAAAIICSEFRRRR